MSQFMENIIRAHALTGAPGRVVGYWGSGHYEVEIPKQRNKKFRMRTHGMNSDRVTVLPCWSIGGARQRRQATVG